VSAAGSPFSPRAVLAMLAVGAGAFVLFLYAIGAGWDGGEDRDGGAHAAATGLNGYAGLVRLLEARGHRVELSRSEARLDDPGLLVLTPPLFTDGEALSDAIAARRYIGPTLLILPKWLAGRIDRAEQLKARRGWVTLGGSVAPGWLDDVEGFDGAKLAIARRTRWQGLGLAGALPAPGHVLTLAAPDVVPLVSAETGAVLAGFVDDGGAYPVLDEAAGRPPRDAEAETLDGTRWALVVVAEPDLMNNYAMADRARAELAERLVVAAMEGQERSQNLAVVFDLTLPGLGRSENLMTLAFTPPFLAATLCLILAGVVVAWRAFRRFGPAVAEAPALAMGKRQLAGNAAALIERARRLHLLGPPYAALVAERIAAALAIRESDPAAREAAIARVLAARGIEPDYAGRAEALRRARRPADLLRAAGALRTIERTLAS